MSTPHLIPTAEAAFIAGLTDRQMNRVVDEHLVPEPLVMQHDGGRLFTRLGAAFASFYFSTEDLLLANARRQMLVELTQRVTSIKRRDDVLTLVSIDSVNWTVVHKSVAVDVFPYIQDTYSRAMKVDQAETLVTADPDILGGVPVFSGTRVPVEVVLSSLANGIAEDRLMASYPFLTKAHIDAAEVYGEVHPRRGRPRRISDVNPELPRRVTRVIRRGSDV